MASKYFSASVADEGRFRSTSTAVSGWVERWSGRIPERARVLDFACGAGRNLPPLLARGARITAADRDPAALAAIRARFPENRPAEHRSADGAPPEHRSADGAPLERAEAAASEAPAPDLHLLLADLENAPWPFAPASFDAVVCCNFLHRPRLDLMAALLAPGGLLIHETFADGNAKYGRPSNPAFLLRAGELFRSAERAGLVVLAFEHGYVDRPGPALVQRVCAVRPPFDPERLPVG
jgi:SAM-dependent methyltransferase